MSNVIQFASAALAKSHSGSRDDLAGMILAEVTNPAGLCSGRDSLNTEARDELIKLGEMLTAKVAIRKAQTAGGPP